MSRESQKPDWTGTCLDCGESLEDHAGMEYDGNVRLICPVEAIAVDAETSQQPLTDTEVQTDHESR